MQPFNGWRYLWNLENHVNLSLHIKLQKSIQCLQISSTKNEYFTFHSEMTKMKNDDKWKTKIKQETNAFKNRFIYILLTWDLRIGMCERDLWRCNEILSTFLSKEKNVSRESRRREFLLQIHRLWPRWNVCALLCIYKHFLLFWKKTHFFSWMRMCDRNSCNNKNIWQIDTWSAQRNREKERQCEKERENKRKLFCNCASEHDLCYKLWAMHDWMTFIDFINYGYLRYLNRQKSFFNKHTETQ